MSPLSRRAAIVAGGALVTLVVAGDDDALAAPPPAGSSAAPPPALRLDGRISRNHGHVLALSLADVDAGADRTFDLSGTSGHRHEVTFTRAHLAELKRGAIVRLASTSFGGHLHRIYAHVRPAVLPADEQNVCDVFIGGKDDHELVIPRGHLDGEVDRTYDIQANSPHTHQLVLRAGDFARLRKGEKVVVTSGRGAEDHHTHVVFITAVRRGGGEPAP